MWPTVFVFPQWFGGQLPLDLRSIVRGAEASPSHVPAGNASVTLSQVCPATRQPHCRSTSTSQADDDLNIVDRHVPLLLGAILTLSFEIFTDTS